tara:strand:- start:2701 stop:3162 length:462 start_codon:yes stop_codon:yes gene_type:complete
MYKKGTISLLEADYKERTGLKRGEKGKTNSKRVKLARDLKKIRKGGGGRDTGGSAADRVLGRSRLNKLANASELSRDIGRGKYAVTRTSKKDREGGPWAVDDANNRRKKRGYHIDRKRNVGSRALHDREATHISSDLAFKAERSNARRKRTKK